jgi:hypothetical protein
MVSALYFNSQSRWGIQSDSQEIRTYSLQFLIWMEKEGLWEQAHSVQKTPPHLMIFLSRKLFAFKKIHMPKNTSASSEPSYSARRTLLELPLPSAHIEAHLLDAFSALTQKLPQELRLSYQLHLEGLLNHEISHLLMLPENTVQQNIEKSKTLLTDPDSWRHVA